MFCNNAHASAEMTRRYQRRRDRVRVNLTKAAGLQWQNVPSLTPAIPYNPDMQQDSEGPSMKTMSATAASKEFGRFIDAAQREPVLLTKKDRPVAVTVSVADWEELLSLRIERGIAAGLADVAAGRVVEMTDAALEQRLARFRTRSAEA